MLSLQLRDAKAAIKGNTSAASVWSIPGPAIALKQGGGGGGGGGPAPSHKQQDAVANSLQHMQLTQKAPSQPGKMRAAGQAGHITKSLRVADAALHSDGVLSLEPISSLHVGRRSFRSSSASIETPSASSSSSSFFSSMLHFV